MKMFKSLSLLLTILCSLLPAPLYCQWLEATVPVGDYPHTLVYNSTDNKVYCANVQSNNVTVIDKYNSVIKTITVGDQAWALVYNSLNNKIYCANRGNNNVTVINSATDSVITTVPAGNGPWVLVWNSTNNKVYCVNEGSNNVTVIDGSSDSVIKTIPAGDWPYALIYNSINKKVYCANTNSDDVTVFDGAPDSVITTITVGGGPSALAWNPIENRTYVANYWSFTVSVIRDTIIQGIEETSSLNSISFTPEIYPNPARSFLAIRLSQSADCQTIKIFDVSGKLVKVEKKVTSPQSHKQEIRISLKGINPGIYFFRLGKETKKFLIVK
jgi:YVTN family beta-propeller protein